MDLIKLTPNGGNPVYLCSTPEKISYGGTEKFLTYNIISLGDVKVPRGSALEEIEWNGIFPGYARRNEPMVYSNYWRSPKEYILLFRAWRDNGVSVQVSIENSGISQLMYVEKFEGDFTGGYGDFEYSIRFVNAHKITITTENGKQNRIASMQSRLQTSNPDQRTRSVVVQEGDTLWSIAEQYLKDGNRYIEIMDMNQGLIGDRFDIPVGEVLTIPAW